MTFLFKRTTIIFVVLFFMSGSVLFRLFQSQVLEHNHYIKLASAQSISEKVQPATRGRIFATDKDGRLYVLAVSQWRYQLLVSPRQVKNKQKLAELLNQDLPDLKVVEILAKIDNDKVYVPPLLKGLDETKAQQISAKG